MLEYWKCARAHSNVLELHQLHVWLLMVSTGALYDIVLCSYCASTALIYRAYRFFRIPSNQMSFIDQVLLSVDGNLYFSTEVDALHDLFHFKGEFSIKLEN